MAANLTPYAIAGVAVTGALYAVRSDPTLPAPTEATLTSAVALALTVSGGNPDWSNLDRTRVGLWGLTAADAPVAGAGTIAVADATVNAQQMWKKSRGGTTWLAWPEAARMNTSVPTASAAVKQFMADSGGKARLDPGAANEIVAPGELAARGALSSGISALTSGIGSLADLLKLIGTAAAWFVTGGWWRVLLVLGGALVLVATARMVAS